MVGAKVNPTSVSNDTTTLYPDALQGTDVAAQSIHGGIRLMSVHKNTRSPTSVSYRLNVPEGTELVPQGDGHALVHNGDVIAAISAPWATDGSGKSVGTSYSFEDGVLTQRLAIRPETRYPIIADPTIWYSFPNYFVKLSRGETKWAAGKSDYGLVGLAACGLIGNVGGAVVCGIIGGAALTQLGHTVDAANDEKKCVRMKFVSIPLVLTLWYSGASVVSC